MPVELSALGLLIAMAAAEPPATSPARAPEDIGVTLELLEYLADLDTAPAWVQQDDPSAAPPEPDSKTPEPQAPHAQGRGHAR